MRGKKGQVIFYGLMLGIVVIMLALGLAGSVKTSVDTARNSSNMDCDNSSISDFDKAGCIATDMAIFYFVGGLIFIGGSIIVARIIIQ